MRRRTRRFGWRSCCDREPDARSRVEALEFSRRPDLPRRAGAGPRSCRAGRRSVAQGPQSVGRSRDPLRRARDPSRRPAIRPAGPRSVAPGPAPAYRDPDSARRLSISSRRRPDLAARGAVRGAEGCSGLKETSKVWRQPVRLVRARFRAAEPCSRQRPSGYLRWRSNSMGSDQVYGVSRAIPAADLCPCRHRIRFTILRKG
jgi:hypothetical protein